MPEHGCTRPATVVAATAAEHYNAATAALPQFLSHDATYSHSTTAAAAQREQACQWGTTVCTGWLVHGDLSGGDVCGVQTGGDSSKFVLCGLTCPRSRSCCNRVRSPHDTSVCEGTPTRQSVIPGLAMTSNSVHSHMQVAPTTATAGALDDGSERDTWRDKRECKRHHPSMLCTP